MSALSMSRTERETFLSELHVGVLSVERSDDPPLLSPLWYRYTPGGAVEFNTESAAEKARLMEACGRASLCVQREESPPAYVTVEGTVSIEPATDEIRLDIASRYLGPDGAKAYLEVSEDDLTVVLSPQRWRTVDFAKL
jgi:nitroimidazol reductase NimA-like FMN-containing flavoprotein (pyridoxamine 5'-phosphate oxidase superfamily)